MEQKQNKWKLVVNTVGDTERNRVYLNNSPIQVQNASLDMDQDSVPTLTLKIPIYSDNLEVITDNNAIADEHIEANWKGLKSKETETHEED